MTEPPRMSSPPPGDSDAALVALRDALGPDLEIKRALGTGSVATVYLAKEAPPLNRLVAVKVLSRDKALDETIRQRFEREAKAAASLSHPNVVQVYRFGRLPDETPYLVMRFVKGRTMEERLKAEGNLPAALAERVLTDVCSALATAHARGIVHRDVRPANVLWDEERDQALLTDFGIAAILATGGEEVTRLTKAGQMIGDPRYLSPEQLLDNDLTELADMYSVGVMGYELLTGSGPYEARTNTQWITAHLSAEPVDLAAVRPDVPARTVDLLRRCLNKEPNHRPAADQAVRILEGAEREAGAGSAGEGLEAPLTVQGLLHRRVPQFIGAALTAGAGFLGFVFMLHEAQLVSYRTFLLALPLASCGVAAATVIAWFHGERGRQEASVIEWVLLSLIGVGWIGWSAAIFVSGG